MAFAVGLWLDEGPDIRPRLRFFLDECSRDPSWVGIVVRERESRYVGGSYEAARIFACDVESLANAVSTVRRAITSLCLVPVC